MTHEQQMFEALLLQFAAHFPEHRVLLSKPALHEVIQKHAQKRIFISSLPKTGSTFLWRLMEHLTGFQSVILVEGYAAREQELSLLQLYKYLGKSTVSRHHTRASAFNLDLISLFAIRPVILVRNIFDIIVSTVDHLDKDNRGSSMFHTNHTIYQTHDRAKRVDMLIDLAVPWHIYFYTSWRQAIEDGKVDALWLSYEDLFPHTAAAVQSVLQFCGVSKSDAEIDEAVNSIDKEQTRFNKGVSGRGQEQLTEQQMERVRQYASYYPNVDFSGIGL